MDKLTLFGDMVVFSSYAMQVIMSFMMLVMIFIMFPRASISAKRILEVLETNEKITDGDIAAFCTALEQERPDRAALRRAAISKWRQFGRTLAVNERELCQQIADSLLDAGESSGVPERFNKNVAELKKTLLKRQKNSAFLTQVLDRMTPPMLRLRTILRVWEQDGSPLSDRQREFFTRTLDLYLR